MGQPQESHETILHNKSPFIRIVYIGDLFLWRTQTNAVVSQFLNVDQSFPVDDFQRRARENIVWMFDYR